MKIAYLSTFYPYRGGIAQFNASLFEEFKKGHTIKAFTFKRQYPDFLFPGESQYVSESDAAVQIPAERVLDSINPLTFSSASRAINRYSPDLMIMKYWMPFFAPSLGCVARKVRKNGTKNFAILDNVIPHERRHGDISLTKFFLNQCDGFIVMSGAVKNDLLSLKPSAKYCSLQHPLYSHFGEKIDKQTARDRLGIPQKAKVLLFFGFIRKYKGLNVLIDALSQLPEDYYLIIAGETYGNKNEYIEQIERLGISNKTSQLLRYISDEETPAIFSAADLCVLPYLSATQSGITGISYHFDVPVLATDVGGLKESIEPFSTGIMVPEAKPDIIRDAVIDFFEKKDPQHFKTNIQKLKEICSWENFACGMTDFYKTL